MVGFVVTHGIFLFLSLTIISAEHTIYICQQANFISDAFSNAVIGCKDDHCPGKCWMRRMGWLNENSELIKDEATLAERLKSLSIRDMHIAQLYAEAYFVADCPRMMTNVNDCDLYDDFYDCSTHAGCEFTFHPLSPNLTKYSDVQYWNELWENSKWGS